MIVDIKKMYDAFSIFPVNADKTPVSFWSVHRNIKIQYDKLAGHDFFAAVCGFDNLEVIDIDNHFGDAEKLYAYITDNVPDLMTRLPIIKTQSGGYHVYLKCKTIAGNQKLAQRVNSSNRPDTLVETRGTGGYVLCPPSPGYDLINGDIYNVPVISQQERQDLLEICMSLNEVESNTQKPTIKVSDDKPGDRYNNQPGVISDVAGMLKRAGWYTRDDKHWRRPGKYNGGPSATLGKVGKDKFYVFSTNAHPFNNNTSYSPFAVYALLEHNGNYSSAASTLSKQYNMLQKAGEKPKPIKDTDDNTPTPARSGGGGGGAARRKWEVLLQIIDEWKLQFRYNTLTKIIEFKKGDGEWEQLGLLPNDIVMEMETKRGISSIGLNKVIEMISNNTIANVYNPVSAFFDTLPKWDGVDYFKELCKYIVLGKDEDPIYFCEMLKKHLFRTVRCALEKDYVNRMVLVFYGPQEIGKTLFFRWLCPSELYNQENIDPLQKDSILVLARYMLCNLDELDELNKREVSRLKAFISKGDIKQRVAYGRHDEQFDRVCSFVGSTNKTDLLSDDSNTRWIILKVDTFKWQEYTKSIDVLQLWAQAKENMYNGELNKEEKIIRDTRNNTHFLETSTEREIIERYFEESSDFYLTATDIKILIEKWLPPQRVQQHALVRELRRVFGQPVFKRINGKVGRFYPCVDLIPKQQQYMSEKFASDFSEVSNDNIPF